MSFTGDYDFKEVEKKWIKRWEEMDLYRFEPESEKPIFSIDTPPPTVSGDMHIGHAYSYTQMDIMARYKRMRGYNLFYPWGWDDNGIATELFVINETGVDPREVGRKKFRDICIEESEKLEENLERKWKRIGTSADFDLFYRTIDERTLKTSQKSFIDLYERGREYRKEAPTLWCPHCETAISQVETEDMKKEGRFNNIYFALKDGGELVISTTRPELLPACVAVFVHPEDEEHNHLAGRKAEVPLFGQEVPIYEDEEVDMDTGTGVVMCCTFGDQADIDWWYAHDLPLRIAIDETGYMTDVADEYEGMHVEEAKEKIIEDLEKAGKLSEQWDITHDVKVHERCDTPIEFLVTEQWFIEYLDLRDKYLEVGEELDWYPDHMKVRYDNWVNSLKWDWCISRQRYHGIPFPVWYCRECGEVKVAKEENLPVNPLVDEPKGGCEACGSTDFEPEEDVLDTWATSSLTPYIATRWIEGSEIFEKVFPFDLRPQSHDIISFWAFNTIVKSLFHSDTRPWDEIMIHGYLMLPGGKAFSSSKGIIIDPEEVADEYGADSIRYLAGINKPGEDGEYEKKWLKRGQRIRTKFWNAQKLIANSLEGKPEERPALKLMDKWLLTRYSELVEKATDYMEDYRYDKALQETEYFLWHVLADHYLEMVKYRIYEQDDEAAEYVLYHVGLGITKLLAPFLSFITEEVYDRIYKGFQDEKSIHVESWPESIIKDRKAAETGERVKELIAEIRNWKSDQGIPLSDEIGPIRLVTDNEDMLACEADILNTLNASEIQILDEEEIKEEAVEIRPDYSEIGPKYKDKAKEVFDRLEETDPEKVRVSFEENGSFDFELSDGSEVSLTEEEVELGISKVHEGETLDSISLEDMVILLEKE
ncbi:MAG: valine--tRNA ligase [Candidatus Thermoplasmatota archaeon]|nr:valine--tRNA ligase [Candidatus Thermoplasmatota archaeon]